MIELSFVKKIHKLYSMRLLTIIILFFVITSSIDAQIIDGDITKYGNEWIDYNKTYHKISIKKDGIYQISYQQLQNAGIDMNNVSGKDFQLHVYGKEIPIYTSTQGKFGSSDYIEFYGEKNRSQLDYFLYRTKYFLFNPEYSLFTDDASYFLTWDKNKVNKRFASIDNDLTGSLPDKEEFYLHSEKLVNHTDFIKPLRDQRNHIYKSNFDIGEGFGSKLQNKNTFILNTSNFIYAGVKPKLYIRYTTNLGKHHINFSLNNKFLKQNKETGFVCKTFSSNLSKEDIEPEMKIILEGVFNDDFLDRNSVSVISLDYTRAFDFLNKSFYKFNIESSSFSKYIEIENFDVSGNSLVLYDIKNNTRLTPTISNNLVQFKLSPSDSTRELVLVNVQKSISQIESIKKVEFVDFLQLSDKNYIILTDKGKFIDENQVDWVEEYANYRSSVIGGSFKTLIVDVNDIYNQFGYGIDRHVQGVNNFIIYLKDNFVNPEYIFIIGKGLEYNEMRTESQLAESKGYFFVPTFGYPGSDNLLGARFGQDFSDIPIGRIAVKNYEQINTYLDKVKKHEDYLQYSQTIEDKFWMKKIIHLVGGTPDIIDQIENYLKVMGSIISKNNFGADIHTYKRTSGGPQESVTKIIIKDIEEGAGIVSFFGHSGISGTDFNIRNLKNERYPVFYSFGCYSGNIHTTVAEGQSEKFVLSDNGVIVYAGTSGTGFTGSLGSLGKKVYEYSGNSYYGDGLGKIVQRAIKVIGENNFDIGAVTLNQQFTFHGDPAVSLFKHPGPDYLIDYTTVKTNPSIINSNSQYFNINFDVVNIGVGIRDTLSIKLLRKNPNGKIDTIFTKIKAPGSRDNISIQIPTNNIDGIGENCISIFLDPKDKIKELPDPDAEENNELSNQDDENKFCFFIINNGAKPIYPEEFSIINTSEIELKASSFNYFVDPQKYIFEIDTTELFNSAIHKRTSIITNGGIISWNPNINFEHNVVYYWRISPDSISPSSPFIWENSSFIYLSGGSEGWNQSHYFQYLKDDFDKTEFKDRKFDFISKKYTILIKGKKYDPTSRKVAYVDGEGWGNINPKIRPSICITGWGPRLWKRNDTGHDYNSIQNSTKFDQNFTYQPMNKEHRKGIKELLESIPDSMVVFFYTVLGTESQSLKPEEWAQDSIDLGYNLFSVLESYGATKIRLMETKGTVPYVFIFKKGKGVLQERIGKTINDRFELEQDVTLNYPYGKFYSKIIGPATDWKTFRWDIEETGDTTEYSFIKVHKLSKDFKQDIIVDSISVYQDDLDLSSINAEEFPYLKLEFYAFDKFNRDPPNINYWRVMYNGLPDAALINDDKAYFYKDTLDFGDMFKFRTTVFNTTNVDMDSLLVKFRIKKQNNEEITVIKKYAKLLGNSNYYIEFEYPSNELQGVNEFTVELNPTRNQKEKFYFNNIGIKRFYVTKDIENPLMDVTFNGKHIMDGDIVNPRAEISIMLNDNNKFLLLNDKSIFKKLTIITPSGVIKNLEEDPEVEFIPAESLDNNVAKLIYTHDFFDEEGEYQLICQASDISGNLSGENEYKISFKIILKEQISNVYNYPNPFSTKTRFVFKLTGIDVPENIVIKIMTLSGKIVRELTSIDLGEIQISENNMTKPWDGTDEYGRKLANGIYLYQVKAVNSAGEEFDFMGINENDDKFFKKGFGKLVILR